MHRWLVRVVTLGVLGMACAEAFQPHADIVARAGDSELTVTRLAEIVASARDLPVDREVVELLAYRWTEWAVFAGRAAAGDSLVDSATVVTAMWPDTRSFAVDSFHGLIIGDQIEVNESQVDSAYRAGNHIIVAHVLKAVSDSTTAEERTALRADAERIYARLADGSWNWDRANADSDDQVARERQGILGVLQRGMTDQRFENAAFALGDGEVSNVVETPAGYHIVYRPALDDVRADYTETVRAVFMQRQDSIYEEHLLETYDVSFRSDAPEKMRESVSSPFRARGSNDVLATFDGGELTVGDFIRWLQVFPGDVVANIPFATDEQTRAVGRSILGRELIWRQADSAGISYTADQFNAVAEQYRSQMENLRALTQLYPDSLAHYGPDPAARNELADVLVDQYLERGVLNRELLVPVPAFLAERLMAEADWEVVPSGVLRATERAATLRAAMPPVVPGGGW